MKNWGQAEGVQQQRWLEKEIWLDTAICNKQEEVFGNSVCTSVKYKLQPGHCSSAEKQWHSRFESYRSVKVPDWFGYTLMYVRMQMHAQAHTSH